MRLSRRPPCQMWSFNNISHWKIKEYRTLHGFLNTTPPHTCKSYLSLKLMLPIFLKYSVRTDVIWYIYDQYLNQTPQTGVTVFTWGHPWVRWGFLPGTGLLPVKVVVSALAVSTCCQRLLKGTVTWDKKEDLYIPASFFPLTYHLSGCMHKLNPLIFPACSVHNAICQTMGCI